MVFTKRQVAQAVPALALLLATGAKANSFGNYVSTGGVNSGNSIILANATLILPDTPNPVVNEASLWVGMGMSNGDLVQAIAASYPGTSGGNPCGDIGSNWCIFCSTLESGNNYQSQGNAVEAYPGDRVTMTYTYNDQTTDWDQVAYINGNQASTFSSSAGANAQGFGSAEECQPGTPCGVMPQHQWVDMTLVLRNPDPDYGSTFGLNGASGSISTPDGGTTWVFSSTVTIDQFDFTTGK